MILYMANLPDILGQLPALPKADRDAIKARLIALDTLDTSPSINSPSTSQDGVVLHAICDFMRQNGLENPPIASLTKSPQYHAFALKCPQVISYLGSLSKLERETLLFIGIGVRYDNLCEMGVVVTARTLMSHIHRLPGALNRSFPGYAKSGYLKLIVRKKNGHVRQE